MPKFTHDTAPGLSGDELAALNNRYEMAAARVAPTIEVDPGFWDRLAVMILDDFRSQKTIAEAMTTYKARGNREDLA